MAEQQKLVTQLEISLSAKSPVSLTKLIITPRFHSVCRVFYVWREFCRGQRYVGAVGDCVSRRGE